MSMRKPAGVGRICFAVAFTLLLTQLGCVERIVIVKSDPPGASVYVEEDEIGPTPCSFSFTHYGTHRIRLELDGYERKVVMQPLKRPWYEVFPLDFFAEVLWPGKIVDHHEFAYDLEPAKPVDKAALLKRAEELRARTMLPGNEREEDEKEKE